VLGLRRTENDGADHRFAQRELQRGGRELDSVLAAHHRQPLRLRDHLRGGVAVLVAGSGAGRRRREQPGVERARDDDPDAALPALRDQLGRRRLLEQRVAAGDHQQVHLARAHARQVGRHRLRPDADRAHETFLAQRDEGGHRARDGPLHVGVLVGIVQEQHVDAVEAQPFERLVEAAAHAVGRGVPHAAGVGGHHEPAFLVQLI
jgi:hypothetical protein